MHIHLQCKAQILFSTTNFITNFKKQKFDMAPLWYFFSVRPQEAKASVFMRPAVSPSGGATVPDGN